jgi:hypothetical protein
VVDGEVLALGAHDHHALYQIVDVAQAARLGAIACLLIAAASTSAPSALNSLEHPFKNVEL